MSKLIAVKYANRTYPERIIPQLEEIPVDLDSAKLYPPSMDYCLFTESSLDRRQMTSTLLDNFTVLRDANKRGVPLLWFDERWTRQYIDFLDVIMEDVPAPKYVQVHPPFNDYCGSFDAFLKNYEIFEKAMLERFPGVQMLLENRYSSRYPGGTFIVADVDNILAFADELRQRDLNLKLSLGITELISINGGPKILTEKRLETVIPQLTECRDMIIGLRPGGKMRDKTGRVVNGLGDLKTYFEGRLSLKNRLMEMLFEIFDDGNARLFTPEVRYFDQHLASIVEEFENVGFVFE